MLIVSWNVAGWDATLKYIKSHYKSLEDYLDRHGIDVLCLQEVKVTRQRLGSEPASVGAHAPGWDSFWSTSTSKKGFNGVTTFARKGLTTGADAQCLQDKAFDAEGRCIVTHHGEFSIFNVYAHSTGDDPDGSKQACRALLGAPSAADHSYTQPTAVPTAPRLCVAGAQARIPAGAARVDAAAARDGTRGRPLRRPEYFVAGAGRTVEAGDGAERQAVRARRGCAGGGGFGRV